MTNIDSDENGWNRVTILENLSQWWILVAIDVVEAANNYLAKTNEIENWVFKYNEDANQYNALWHTIFCRSYLINNDDGLVNTLSVSIQNLFRLPANDRELSSSWLEARHLRLCKTMFEVLTVFSSYWPYKTSLPMVSVAQYFEVLDFLL